MFLVGEKVQHKSGGPMMVAFALFESNLGPAVNCRWYDPLKNIFMTEIFAESELINKEESEQ